MQIDLEDEVLEILQHDGGWMEIEEIHKTLKEFWSESELLDTLERLTKFQQIKLRGTANMQWRAVVELA